MSYFYTLQLYILTTNNVCQLSTPAFKKSLSLITFNCTTMNDHKFGRNYANYVHNYEGTLMAGSALRARSIAVMMCIHYAEMRSRGD